MTHWKTTLFGILAAIGLGATSVGDPEGLTIFEIVAIISVAGLGFFAAQEKKGGGS
jgi:hypothetical protein